MIPPVIMGREIGILKIGTHLFWLFPDWYLARLLSPVPVFTHRAMVHTHVSMRESHKTFLIPPYGWWCVGGICRRALCGRSCISPVYISWRMCSLHLRALNAGRLEPNLLYFRDFGTNLLESLFHAYVAFPPVSPYGPL